MPVSAAWARNRRLCKKRRGRVEPFTRTVGRPRGAWLNGSQGLAVRQEKSEAERIVHSNVELIRRFYTSFANRDARGMAACYHPAVTFSDEIFSDLEGARAVGMWRMLCERGRDLRIEFRDIEADDSAGGAHWEAFYTFSSTGRQVHNRIDAHFEFRDGKIIRHRDRFNFWNWARQALGPTGWLLGWSGFVRNRVRSQAMRNLASFLEEHGQ